MSLKVGLTGGIASGKSTVTELFSGLGITIIDADLIARELVEVDSPCYHRIVSKFGLAMLHPDGTLNRARLRQLVFSDPDAKHKLEAILHPAVRQQLKQRAEQSSSPYCILSIPLLLEAEMTDLADRILVVDVSESTQLARLCNRDKLSETEAMAMISSQVDRQQRLAVADDVISNDGSLTDLAAVVNKYHQKYLQIAAAK